jgi:hypothetical protein
MRELWQPPNLALSLLLLTLPACHSLEGRWPWSASQPVAAKSAELDVPPTAGEQTDTSDGPSHFAEDAEPDRLPMPARESPAVARDRATTEPLPAKPTAAVAEPGSGRLAPTDPPPLARPKAVEPHPAVAALQLYLDERPDEAVKVLSIYDARDQELLLSLMPLLAQVARGGIWLDRLTPEEKLIVAQQIGVLFRDLRRTAPLVIARAVFCRSLQGYGQPAKVSSPTFRPGDWVFLYVEVENLVDRQINSDQFAICLSGKFEVRDSEGRTVWTKKLDETPSVSQSPRHDHFTLIKFTIPRTLPPGVYSLQISITDHDTHREAGHSIQFRVAS